MIFKARYLLLTFFVIIVFQTLLYTNNNQRTSFRYLKWTIQEVSIGKLISASFFTGLLLSTIVNYTIPLNKKNNSINKEEYFEDLNIEKDNKSNIEMPPQRDIRDAQPTISVNYRVVKNKNDNDLNNEPYFSDNSDNNDDWITDDNEW